MRRASGSQAPTHTAYTHTYTLFPPIFYLFRQFERIVAAEVFVSPAAIHPSTCTCDVYDAFYYILFNST